MRWVLAGVLFALAVSLAIGTAAIRAENVRCRGQLETAYWAIKDNMLEARRLSIRALRHSTPERLAAALRGLLDRRSGDGHKKGGQEQDLL